MQSERIRFRPVEEDDLDFLADLANDPEVRRRVVGWDWPLSRAGQSRWFASGIDSSTTRRFLVETLDGRPLGLTGLWEIDLRNRSAMTALKLGGTADVRGKGYGAEAVRLMMDFAFRDVGLHRLHSTILATNAPSLAVYVRKCGWREEGRLRDAVWRDGGFVDLIQIGVLSDDACAPGSR